jgi:Zn-dependent protease with chaperone function
MEPRRSEQYRYGERTLAAGSLGLVVVLVMLIAGCSGPTRSQQTIRESVRKSGFDDPLTLEAFTTLAKLIGRDEIQVAMMPSGIVNAASAGDGHFYVTDILVKLRNPCLTWGIAAHEMGHDKYGHARERARTSGALGLLVLPALLVPGANLIVPVVAGSALNAYSRSQEEEADAFAVEVLTIAGKPTWIRRYTLEFYRDAYGDKGGWFATHPLTSERIALLPQIDQQAAITLCGRNRPAQIALARTLLREWAVNEKVRMAAERARIEAEREPTFQKLRCSSTVGPRSSSCPPVE